MASELDQEVILWNYMVKGALQKAIHEVKRPSTDLWIEFLRSMLVIRKR